MGRVIAVTNLKGGIGKTTTVVNVGAGLALKGAHVLLVDVDAQGNLALALGVKPRRTLYEVLVDGARIGDCITSARPNLDLLAGDDTLLTAQPTIARRPDWTRVLDQVLRPLHKSYDYILVDCGGSLTVLNVNALVASSDVLVPTTVEHLSIKGLELLFKQVVRVKNSTASVRIIVPTMFDPRLRQAGTLLAQLQTNYGALVAPPIRINVRLSEASAEGRTIYEYDPRSRGALDYAQLVEHLAQILGHTAPAATLPPPTPPAARATAVPAAPPPPPEPVTRVPLPTLSAAATREAQPVAAEQPVVTGAGISLQLTCPHCGRTLQRATIAGYRVAFCDHCKYKQQELATGVRR